jgi:uncharacterized membrane protein YgdD (TMEM256/DUF423 family)
MTSRYLAASAITGFIAVALGAAGDHLAELIVQEHAFETALRYNQLYSLLMVALALHTMKTPEPWPSTLRAARAVFMAGALLFCGSLYALAFTGMAALGYMTPFGGIMLMAGWLLLAAYAFKAAKSG